MSIRKWHVDPKFMFPISQERCVKTHNLGGYRYMTVLMPRHTGAEQFGWWDLTALLGDIDSDEKVPEVHHQDMANTLDCRLERPPLVAGEGCRRSRHHQECTGDSIGAIAAARIGCNIDEGRRTAEVYLRLRCDTDLQKSRPAQTDKGEVVAWARGGWGIDHWDTENVLRSLGERFRQKNLTRIKWFTFCFIPIVTGRVQVTRGQVLVPCRGSCS